jgi:hypothetical protein
MIGVSGLLSGKRRLPLLLASLSVACALAGCNNEASDPSSKAMQCAKQHYADFNPKNMQQCVDVCISCERGSMTTCSTSCTMKGAK